MKVLVLVEDYPNNTGGRNLMYVHTRNLYYHNKGIEVDVVNFSSSKSYIIDGINVLTLNEYKLKHQNNYDLLIIHAANLRHHYLFLKKYGKLFNRFLFFYHGHEVLKINKVYPEPYYFVKGNVIKKIAQNIYDSIKFMIWRLYIPKIKYKSTFIFVSEWMLSEFEKWIKISRDDLKDRYFITYNCVAECFEKESYNDKTTKEYDFITIRGNLDNSKYSVDIVNDLAKENPSLKFLLIGKGDFFNYFAKSENIKWLNTTLNHEEIMKALNTARFALMPTRTDAQGLMMCEMAAFGIPVITSDIPVCHEVFDGFSNVYFINNNTTTDLSFIMSDDSKCIKDDRYYYENTVGREYNLIYSLIDGENK